MPHKYGRWDYDAVGSASVVVHSGAALVGGIILQARGTGALVAKIMNASGGSLLVPPVGIPEGNKFETYAFYLPGDGVGCASCVVVKSGTGVFQTLYRIGKEV